MERVKRSENLKLLPLAVLLIITPLLSTSLRFKYLYLIVNILIISVGAEAGLFSFFLHSEENRKPATPPVHSLLPPPQKSTIASVSNVAPTIPAKAVGESAVEPSIFFIEGSESEEEDDDDDKDEETVEENNAEDHELYQKSEKFIGNFYKQLKMQREKSWNEIH